jgi:hypothetical protein
VSLLSIGREERGEWRVESGERRNNFKSISATKQSNSTKVWEVKYT